MNTTQTIGVVMVIVSLLGIVLLSLPVGTWWKQLGAGRRNRAQEPAPPQEEGSLFDGAPRDELDQLGAEETPTTMPEPQAAVVEEAADSGADAPPPAEPPAAPRPRRRRSSTSGSP